GLPVQQIFAAATDPGAHDLSRAGLLVATDCARGVKDDAIVSKYQNKIPKTPPDADDPPLNAPALLTRAVTVSESQCKTLRNAVWVRAMEPAIAYVIGYRRLADRRMKLWFSSMVI